MSWLSKLKSIFKKPVANEFPKEKFITEKEVGEIVKNYFQLYGYGNLLKFNSDISYWVAVVKAIIKAESNFNLVEVYWEKDLGNNGYDKYTGRKYLSEGLMQLSYSDKAYYGCAFYWEKDKNLPDQDENKTIFNSMNNIECGLFILDRLVSKNGHYIFDKNNYWAVLKPSNKRHKVFLEAFNKYITEGYGYERTN